MQTAGFLTEEQHDKVARNVAPNLDSQSQNFVHSIVSVDRTSTGRSSQVENLDECNSANNCYTKLSCNVNSSTSKDQGSNCHEPGAVKQTNEEVKKVEYFNPEETISIVHIPNKQDDDVMEIDLNYDNKVIAKLPNDESVITLIDSGASHTLACATFVSNSKFLSNLPKYAIEPVRFIVGNGEYITSEFAIDIPLIIQGHKLIVTARMVSNLGGISLVLGDQSLAEIDSVLFFKSHRLAFKRKSIIIKSSANMVIAPNQSRVIKVTGKLPHVLKNASGLLKSTRFLSQFCPDQMLVTFKDYLANILVSNTSGREITIWENQPIATLNLRSLLNWYDPISSFSRSDDQTIFHFEKAKDGENQSMANQEKYFSVQRQKDTVVAGSRQDLFEKKRKLFPFLESDDPRLKMTNAEIVDRDIMFDDCVLNPEEQKEVKKMLLKYQDALSLHSEVGQTNLTVDFRLSDTSPFFIRPFTVSAAEKPFIDKELDKLVKMGILQEDTSQYSSPIMLIKKKDTTSKRLVADFRFLNNRILKQNLPFPLVKDAIQIIGHSEATVISVLDLKEAYHCLNLTPECQKYCGITSYFGGRSFTYKKLPMGLCVSPTEFQVRINKILSEIQEPNEFCIGIMDDLIIYSKTTTEHHAQIEKILNILQTYGLKISPSKAKLFRRKVIYMGHEIRIEDHRPCITPLRDRTEAIRKLQIPDTKRRLKGFIGKVSYLAMYMPKLQILLKPLHAITSKKAEFIWDEKVQQNYDAILELLRNPPVLTMPRSEGLFRLYADTSKIGVGASLWQLQDGKERLIAYYSKTLPKAASNYGITELELTGLESAISAFKHLLRGVYFECFTDHAAIPQILKAKTEPSSERIKRLLERLSGYCMKVGFRKGSTMVVCDYLSRNPQPMSEKDQQPIAFAVTRGAARREGITVPSIQESASALTSAEKPQAEITVQPVSVADGVIPRALDRPTRSEIIDRPRVQSRAEIPEPRHRLVDNRRPPMNIPIEVQEINEEDVFETHASVPETMLRDKQPLFSDIDAVFLKHLPKQAEISKMLDKIKGKVLRDYHLPQSRREVAKQQSVCPDFSDIYKFILEGLLPSDKQAAKRVMLNAENYILIDNVLFRLVMKEDDCKITLAVPRTMVSEIISLYHDSLLACHQGVMRVSLTIKQRYYFPKLHQRVYDYIKSCLVCQSKKHPVNNERPFELNIPTSYKPFETVYCDLKVMPESYQGHRYILVLVCGITRYVILHPLVSKDAVNVAETILQKCVFTHGPFKRFISDEGKEFKNSVITRIFSALKISQKFVSVGNHQANRSERFVGTAASLLTSCLTGNGKNWHLFCNAVAYAFNSFASPTLGGYSPYYLLYLRDPPPIIDCAPENLAVSSNYKDYVDLLKQRLDSVSRSMLDIEAKLQTKQAQDQLNKVKKAPMFIEGMLVYLLSPTHSSLQTNSRKIRMDFIGPLAIFNMLDRNHAILQTLEGKQIQGIFHIARLKVAWIRTESGAVNTLGDLKKAQHAITDETGRAIQLPVGQLRFSTQRDPVDISLHYRVLEENSNLAAPQKLSEGQKSNLVKQVVEHAQDDKIYDITKARYKLGELQLLLQSSNKGQTFWLNTCEYPHLHQWFQEWADKGYLRITGSKMNFTMRLI